MPSADVTSVNTNVNGGATGATRTFTYAQNAFTVDYPLGYARWYLMGFEGVTSSGISGLTKPAIKAATKASQADKVKAISLRLRSS